jgi:hypothetical protein
MFNISRRNSCGMASGYMNTYAKEVQKQDHFTEERIEKPRHLETVTCVKNYHMRVA